MQNIMRQSMNYILLALLISVSWASHLHAASSKKGIGEYGSPNAASHLPESGVSWYYDWQPTSDVVNQPHGVQFIPMIWGMKNLNNHDLKAAKASGAGTLLTFNEPTDKGQAEMTVQQALDAWPQLEALHMRLGSPAPGTGDDTNPHGWLAQFMAGAKAAGYRVDFICVHAYQSSFDPTQATENLIYEVEKVHKMYNLPIWVTEYAIANWHGSPLAPDYATQAQFAAESANALEAIPYVERYAWFGDVPPKLAWQVSLYNNDGSRTPVGTAWKEAPTLGGPEKGSTPAMTPEAFAPTVLPWQWSCPA